MTQTLTADDLLLGATAVHTVAVPAHLLGPRPTTPAGRTAEVAGVVSLRPLLIRDLDRVVRAAKEQRVLSSVLMVQQSLLNPKLSVEQVGSLPAGLVQYLLEQVNSISGLTLGEDDLEKAIKAPLTKACFVLAREFGWTPAECSELTVGQVLLYLEMLGRDERPAPSAEGAA